jgi:hypothetical protein
LASRLGCPRNNQIFFSVRTGTNRNSICFGCCSVCFAKPKNFFSVCFGVSDRYRNNRNKQNFLKTHRNKPKKSPKNVLYSGVLKTVNFFSRFEPKQTDNLICFCCFLVCFFGKPKIFFSVCFDVLDRYQNNLNKQNFWSEELKDILTNLLQFRLVFCLFRLFRNTETPCFDIKAKQPKQTSCFG